MVPSVTSAGAVASTLHVRLAGVGSVPLRSEARTDHVCEPSARPASNHGEEHNSHCGPESSLHSKFTSVFEEVKLKLADRDLVRPLGPEVIVVSGCASVVNDHVRLKLRALPAPLRVVTLAATLAV